MKSLPALLIFLSLFGCEGPPAPEDEARIAAGFYSAHRNELTQIVQLAKAGPIPSRVEDGEPFADCLDQACAARGKELMNMVRQSGAILMVANKQCHPGPKCSLSILINRRGLGISGSGTELIYDAAPVWGTFVIHRLVGAPPGWFYRHLGD